jgi:hypothetical protein
LAANIFLKIYSQTVVLIHISRGEKSVNNYIISTCLIFFITLPALACSPPPAGFEPPTLAERTLAATFVLEGMVEQPFSQSTLASPDEPFIFTVDRWFKGSGPSKVIVRGFGQGPDCLAPVPSASEKVILFTKGDLVTDGELSLNYLNAFDAVVYPDDTTVENIINTVGTLPTLPGIIAPPVETPNFSTQTNTLRIPKLTVDEKTLYYSAKIEFNFETERFSLKNINTQPNVNADLGVNFKLKMAQSAVLSDEDFRITFSRVAEDSRCPSDVVCIWAGQVTVVLQFALGEQNPEEHSLTLSADNKPAVKQIGKYLVELLKVIPYPTDSNPISVSNYEIILKISLR